MASRLRLTDLLAVARRFPEYKPAAMRAYWKLASGRTDLTDAEKRAVALALYLRNPWGYRTDLAKEAKGWNPATMSGDIPGVDMPTEEAMKLYYWAARYVKEKTGAGAARSVETRRAPRRQPPAKTQRSTKPKTPSLTAIAAKLRETPAAEEEMGHPVRGELRRLLEEATAVAEKLEEYASNPALSYALRRSLGNRAAALRAYVETITERLGRGDTRNLKPMAETLAELLAEAKKMLAEAEQYGRIHARREVEAATRTARTLLEHAGRVALGSAKALSYARRLSRIAEKLKRLSVFLEPEERGELQKLITEIEEAATRLAASAAAAAGGRSAARRRLSPEARRLADYLWENLPRSVRRKWTYVQVLNLARLIVEKAREAGIDPWSIDWLHEIDWSVGYHAAKHTIVERLMAKQRTVGQEELEEYQRYMQMQMYAPRPQPEEEQPERWEIEAWEAAHIYA